MRVRREALPWVAIALLCLPISIILNREAAHGHRQAPEVLLYFPKAQTCCIHALGYEHAIADLLWMRTLAYFGGHYASDRDFRYLARMLDAITLMNPRHESAYYMAATVLPWIVGATQDSIRIATRAALFMPEDGRWLYLLSMLHFLFRDDHDVAAHYLEWAMRRGFINRLSIALAARLQSAAAGLDAARDMLKETIARTSDRRTLAYLHEQLAKVETEIVLRSLERQIEAKGLDRAAIDSTETLRQLGLHWPQPLPDGGSLIVKDGELRSSKSPQRFRLHVSPRMQRLQRGGGS